MAKRKVMMLYGEKTVQVNYRVPKSKKDEIDREISLLLKKYENPTRVDIEVKEIDQSKSKNIVLQKPNEVPVTKEFWDSSKEINNFSDEMITKEIGSGIDKLLDKKPESVKKAPFIPNSVKNKVNIEALRDIASGKGVVSELFSVKNKPIDEEYDCIVVDRGIPDVSERVYVSSKSQVAFYDRDDYTVFYVNLDGKYYRFVNSVEFKRFCKDNGIK